ncbi:MAG TPA: hypothetical protein H9836_03610 [Candidatus Nocardiopsis merdipullorum]|nr:hypothetical protein [Candidatus Nocardiopsis merdipullorum]
MSTDSARTPGAVQTTIHRTAETIHQNHEQGEVHQRMHATGNMTRSRKKAIRTRKEVKKISLSLARGFNKELRAIVPTSMAREFLLCASSAQSTRRATVRILLRDGEISASLASTMMGHAGIDVHILPGGDHPVIVAADHRVALAGALVDGDFMEPRILNEKGMVRMITTIFDDLWDNSECPSRFAPRLPRRRSEIVSCLAAGMTDAAIASRLQVGERTIRREVNSLMHATGAETRFQLGVSVQRRGWLTGRESMSVAGRPEWT